MSYLYFTYISLCVGFAIVPALGSSTPEIWIPVAVIGVLVAGGSAIDRYKKRLQDQGRLGTRQATTA